MISAASSRNREGLASPLDDHQNPRAKRSLSTSRESASQIDAEKSSEVDLVSEAENPTGRQSVTPTSPAVVAANHHLSSFVPTKHDFIEKTSATCTFSLKAGDTLTLAGQYEIWVRKGAISILGAVLHQSSVAHRIYAPSIHSLPLIKAISNPFGLPRQQTIITISSCNSGLRLLRQVSPRFAHLWNSRNLGSAQTAPALDLSKRTFQFLKHNSDDTYKRPLRVLETPSDWQASIPALVSRSHMDGPNGVLICGPKGSGKSTLSRMLTNAILTKPSTTPQAGNRSEHVPCVALLDVDLGQPEFSAPGDISLVQLQCCNFGPPFTHPTASTEGVKHIRSHHIGSISPKDDPQHYLRCVLDLYHHYRQILMRNPSCPLVVNTAGWIQGSGLELLVDFVRYMNFTDVIYTSTQGPVEVVETVSKATAEAEVSLHCLTSQPVELASRSAADLRMMQTLSYFHLDKSERGKLRWNPRPIDKMTPLSVHYAGPNQAIYGVLLLGQELDPEFLDQVLEGCIVGLVVIEDEAALPPLPSAQEPDATASVEASDDEEFVNDTSSPSDLSDPSSVSIDNTTANTIPSSQPRRGSSKPPLSPYPPNYNHHPPLPRTPSSHIPYIPSTNNLRPPLPPTYTHSLGQALIHSISPKTRTINLHTPISMSTLNILHQQQRKLVLIRGNLETPTWAYKEDLYMQISRRKRAVREGIYGDEGGLEGWGKEDTKRWTEGRRWVSLGAGGRKAKVRRVRRDLGRQGKD